MKKILIIEDEEFMAMILKGIITRNFNYEVKIASGLKEGIALSQSFIPDLIITDINLGDGTAYELLPVVAPMREKGMKMIMMSAVDNDTEKEKIMKTGIDLFISKPFTKEKILQSLAQIHFA